MKQLTKEFQDELTELINRHSIENVCDVPDFILAEYLVNQIKAFTNATVDRDHWHGNVHFNKE